MLRNCYRFNLTNVLRCIPVADTYSFSSQNYGRLYSSSGNIERRRMSTNIIIDTTSETIVLEEGDMKIQCPFIWLRDNCRCHSCYQETAGQKLTLLKKLDIDVYPLNVGMHDDQSINVEWSDAHTSKYPLKLLKDVKFPASINPLDGLHLRYWGSEMTRDKIPTFSFHDVMSDESWLYSWLESLHTHGICILNGLGDHAGNLTRLADWVTHPRMTCHGSDFAVKATSEATDLAYTGYPLELHTDLSYYSYGPGVQLLHCIQDSVNGGLSEFADGFKVAYDLKRDDPETFEILSTVPVANVYEGIHSVSKTKYLLRAWKPIIRMSNSDHVENVVFAYSQQDTCMSVEVKDVKKVYKAMKTFLDSLYSRNNLISLKLQPGEAIIVNNTRVLHGRTAFEAGGPIQRHLQGLFLDWDEIYSRMRGMSGK
ncbi:gamma-butyrobetaine dioxygenase-like [Antedon mediterranea]|uniref:gamma-butyrobetaine dioxygenase-like n=1 Tax=Antedon mediterranea TaxID=105859 RepID=UPI003AF99738